MKPRLNIYLDDHIAAQVALLSKRPGTNKSRIVNDALDRFFNPEKHEDTSKALIRRLDRMSNALDRLEQNQSITVETLALFIRYFLTITPPLPESDQASAHAIGRERFDVFVAQVGRRLAQDKNLLRQVLASVVDTRPDLFVADTNTLDKGTTRQEAPEVAAVNEGLPPLRPVHIVDADGGDDTDDLDDLEPFEDGIDDLGFNEDAGDDHVS